MRMQWKKSPAYVEWNLTGDEVNGFGATVYPSVAPMVVVNILDPEYRSYDDVATAVATWVQSVSTQYRLNDEFERFKALAHEVEGEAPPEEGPGYAKPPRG